MEKLDYKYKIALLLLAVLLVNIFWLKSTFIGIMAGISYLVFFGYLCGCVLDKTGNRSKRLIFGPIVLLLTFILFGSIFFYLSILNLTTITIFILIVSIFLIHQIPLTNNKEQIEINTNKEPKNEKKLTYFLVGLYLIVFTTDLCLLQSSATINPIRSIWQVIPPVFFILYGLNTIILLGINFTARYNFFKYIAIFLHFFLTFSLVINIYPLGFGFDSIIHQATEKIILTTGTITPKPFYYIGHYSLTIILSQLLHLDVAWTDKFLLPALLSLFLPGSMLIVLMEKLPQPKNIFALLPLTLLILPYKNFIVTTPQSVANVFLIILIFLAIYKFKDQQTKRFSLLLLIYALIIALIHPLTGICSFIFIILFIIVRSPLKNKLKITAVAIFSLISSFIIPIIFYLSSFLSEQIDISWQKNTSPLFSWPVFKTNYNSVFFNLTYIYHYFFVFFFLGLALIGLAIILKQKKKKWFLLLLPAIIIFINSLLVKKLLNFNHLMSYEKNDYSDRLLEIALYFLIPLFLITWHYIFKKFQASKQFIFALFIFITLLICSNIYLSYPHHDNLETSGLYNISLSDLKTVSFIQKHCADNCVVLANQAVSAAAVRGYGFAKSYQTEKGEIFYYPIPTGGPLYQYYLKMIRNPKKEIMAEIKQFTGAKISYFVINDYWWNSEKTIEKTKDVADAWVNIDNGKVYIFEFR